MPTVPLAGQNETLAPLAERRATTNATADSFGGISGRQMAQVGDAAQRAGDPLASAAIVQRRRQLAEAAELKAQQDADSVRRAVVGFESRAGDYLDNPETGLLTTRRGVDARGVTAQVERDFVRLKADARKDLPNELAPIVDAKLDEAAELARRRARQHEVTETRRAQAESLDAMLQTSVNGAAANATTPDARGAYFAQGMQALEVAADLHGWSAEVAERKRAEYATIVHGKVIEAMLAGGDDSAAREYFDKNLDSINGTARAVITEKFEALERAREAERRRVEAEGERLVDRIERLSAGPYPVSAEALAEVERQVQGTPAAARLAELRDEIEDRAEFAKRPPAEQLAGLTHAANYFQANGVTDPEDQRYVEDRARIFKATMEALRDDPIGYAERQGLAPSIELNMADPRALADGLQARASVLIGLTDTHGSAPKALKPDEADRLAQAFAKGTPTQRAELLRAVEQGIDDPDIFRGTIAQIAPGAPLVSFAGRLAAEEVMDNQPLAARGSAAALVLEGAALLNPPKDSGAKAFPMPKDGDRRFALNDATRDAFADAPEARETVRQGVDAVYAALSAQAGDYSGELDADRYQTAVDKVTGGVIEVNGRHIIKPHTMPEDEFLKALGAVDALDVEMLGGVAGYSNAEAAEAIRDGELVNYQGGYAVRDGSRYLLRADGATFVWRPATTVIRQWRRGERR